MKHILHVVGIALAFLYATDLAMAFAPGVPPLSGPGSVFYGTERAPAPQSHSKKHKSKKHKSKKSRSSEHHSSPQ
jgi:hypothetical protein